MELNFHWKSGFSFLALTAKATTMGQSCTIHSSPTHPDQPLMYLTLEIDRDIRVEISTGFGSGSRPEMSVSIPVTLGEIRGIIERLKELSIQLSNAWKCPLCGLIQEIECRFPMCRNCEHIPEYDKMAAGEFKVQ